MNKRMWVVLVGFMLLTGCSTIMPNLGVKSGGLTPCPESPNCVSSQSDSEKHYIDPIAYKGAQQEAHAKLLQVLESEKRTNILTSAENYIRVAFTSALFRFVDDVEFYFPEPSQPDGAVIHVRSASRIGYSDFGANRKRIEQIRSRFSQ